MRPSRSFDLACLHLDVDTALCFRFAGTYAELRERKGAFSKLMDEFTSVGEAEEAEKELELEEGAIEDAGKGGEKRIDRNKMTGKKSDALIVAEERYTGESLQPSATLSVSLPLTDRATCRFNQVPSDSPPSENTSKQRTARSSSRSSYSWSASRKWLQCSGHTSSSGGRKTTSVCL